MKDRQLMVVVRLIVVLSLAWVSVVAAEPSAAEIKKANNHFKLGQEFFKSRQFDRAIAEYQAALELTGEPLMVFNIALAHDRAGRPEQALAGYRDYLEKAPEGAIADEARQYVARLTAVVDKLLAERAAEDERKAAAAKVAAEEAAREAARQRVVLASGERVREADRLERRARIERWTGLALAVVGGVGVGVGYKFGRDAGDIEDELSAHRGAWTDAQIARDAEGREAESRMILFTSVGGAVILGGGVLYLVGHLTHGKAERLRVGVAAGPQRSTISVAFAF